MAFLASLAALLAVLVILVSTRTWRDGQQADVRRLPQWASVSAVTAAIALGFIYLPTDPLVARYGALAGESISADMRVQIWRDTTRLIKDYPLFGCGLGSYGSCFLRYKTVAPMGTVDYAHNDYLQVLSELGVFGFVAGLALVARVLLLTIRGARYASSADNRFMAIASAGAITAILLHSFVDFNMYVPANGLEFAWILGVAAVYTNSRAGQTPGSQKTALALSSARG
jgi:O-antigen ligase